MGRTNHMLTAWHTFEVAGRNLVSQPVRLIGSVAGVGFAVVLMFVQFGIKHGFLESNVRLIRHMDADLVLVSRQLSTIGIREPLSRRRLREAVGAPGVASVRPLYVENSLSGLRHPDWEQLAFWRAPHAIRVLGIDPESPGLKLPDMSPAALAELAQPGTALYDRRSRSLFGSLNPDQVVELADRKIRLVGSFDLGIDSLADGTLLVSTDTFTHYLRRPFFVGDPFDEVEFGLVRTLPGRLSEARANLKAMFLTDEVEILTVDELIAREKSFWLTMTPVGWVFGFGAWVGLVVGAVVCSQILISDVTDRLSEYATLRAIGYGKGYLVAVVCQQAALLTILGFGLGLFVSWVLFGLLEQQTGLPMELLPHVGWVLFGIAVMCGLAAFAAVYRALSADPAEVFG